FASVSGRMVTLVLRIASIMILGRLLSPVDYGLVGMVTAVTGVLSIVCGFGLFQAAIQRDTMTEDQASTLFWVNVLLGGLLTVIAIALSPAVSALYHEPRLFLISVVMAVGFLITGAGIQHGAILNRQMRFGVSALIDIFSIVFSTAIAVGMAIGGCEYWA